ncbi:PorP/SprF family type IX secretion system membrane protein [Algibacter luteus]|uniref:Type IX secretion system membrane protein, PorP/SprF family n=1 Tax=Algibacter luteus TaxID=1178825 RepID=A0A1M6BTP9_9FLAO|nr:PorP/SprF family type IX secretion system membrane protein [Algibacter luteus]SHI52116.1 type IX secretion system membrane protein, PorP/SprF family [Algibacter luteus]
MKKYLLHIVLFFCITQQLYSQDDGVVAFNMPSRNSLKFNRQYINPTFNFVREQNKYISFNSKREWAQFDNAQQTYLFSYSGRFRENIGAGISLFQQNYGVLTAFGGVANFAYNAVLDRDSNLTFGMNLGFYKSGINDGSVITNFPDSSLDDVPSNSVITLNPGINYGTEFLDFGLSVNNLVSYNVTSSKMIEDNPEHSFQAHIMYTGYMNSRGFFDESRFTGLVSAELRKDQTVVGAMVMLMVPKGIWFQGGYNSLYAFSAGIGLNISPQIVIEYNYEKGVGGFSTFGNAHDFTLAYKFNNRNRYDYAGDDDEEALLIPSNSKRRPIAKRRNTSKSKTSKKKVTVASDNTEANSDKVITTKVKNEINEEPVIQAQEEARAQEIEAARLKAEQEEQARIAGAARVRAAAEVKAKELEDARLKAEQDEQAKIVEAARIKAEADAKANALEEARLKAEQEERARLAEAARVRAAAEAKAKAVEAARLKAEQEERARIAEAARIKAEADAKAKAVEEARLKAEQEERARIAEEARVQAEANAKAKAVEAARLKAEQEEQARISEEAKVQAEADRKAKALEEARIQAEQARIAEEAEAKAQEAPLNEATKSLNELEKVISSTSDEQSLMLNELSAKVAIKQQDLNDLKEENDLSEKGIVSAPKAFKSVSAENAVIESLKLKINNSIEFGNAKITEIEKLYRDRLKKVKSKEDAVNVAYANAIQELKSEQIQSKNMLQNLMTTLDDIKVATDYEKRRRIKRAAYDNEDDRYFKDRATLERIKKFTQPSSQPLTSEDFNHGEALSNIQIVKNVSKVESGYYLVIAVHTDVAQRDAFLEKAVAAGQKDINFFFDVNTSKYYIYYEKYDGIGEAKTALDNNKGNKPYNSKMAMVKIEN